MGRWVEGATDLLQRALHQQAGELVPELRVREVDLKHLLQRDPPQQDGFLVAARRRPGGPGGLGPGGPSGGVGVGDVQVQSDHARQVVPASGHVHTTAAERAEQLTALNSTKQELNRS
eukprot:1188356-Prorocentrum_minimum.AAC.1